MFTLPMCRLPELSAARHDRQGASLPDKQARVWGNLWAIPCVLVVIFICSGGWTLPLRAQTSTALSVEVVLEPGQTFSDGWILASPRFSSNLTYPLVVDDQGTLVRNELNPFRGFNMDLHPDGRLAWYYTQGAIWEVLDSAMQVSGTLDFVGADPDYHDMELRTDGTALLLGQEIAVASISDSAPDPLDQERAIIDCLIQEQDTAGNSLWFWRASDHIPPNWCTHCNWNASLLDAYHHNAFQTLDGGDILLCLRNMDMVARISRATGELVWACGGPFSDFEFTVAGSAFKHPHDAQLLDGNRLLLFDNGTGKNPLVTRAVEYQLDFEAGTITELQEWVHPDGSYASSQGSVQRTEAGGILIGWGTAASDAFGGGMVSEYDAEGSLLGTLYFPSNHYTYRARKVPEDQLPLKQGCRVENACNFDPGAALEGSCRFVGDPCDDGNPCTVADAIQEDCGCAGMLPPEGAAIGCSDPLAVNFDPCAWPDVDDGSCQYAVTFRADATALDGPPSEVLLVLGETAYPLEPGGFGTWHGDLILGAGDGDYHFVADGVAEEVQRTYALNWPLPSEPEELRGCIGLDAAACPGCTDPDDVAYSPFASDDDRCGPGSWVGCTTVEADNFSASAFFDDGSCALCPDPSCTQDLDQDGVVGVSDVLTLLSFFGLYCP